jgi:hypothetical protein
MGPVERPSAVGAVRPGPGHLVWLASYPKSGNTWVRSLLTAYRQAPHKALDINALDAFGASSRIQLDELLGLATSELHTRELRELLPHAYACWSGQDGAPHLLKTHDAHAMTREHGPVFPTAATRCVIHLVRDPRDVAASAMHHWGMSLDRTIACMNDTEYWVSLSHNSPNVPQRLSDWSSHARSWLNCPLPRLTLRYEDLLAEPARHFRAILASIGLEFDEAQLAHAVEACTFERLQAQEIAGVFSERVNGSTAPFFRSGRAGGWRDVLSASQAARIVDAHGETMQRLGYAV